VLDRGFAADLSSGKDKVKGGNHKERVGINDDGSEDDLAGSKMVPFASARE